MSKSLTPTEARILLSICSALKMEQNDRSVIDQEVTLSVLESILPDVEVVIFCKKLHLRDLITYRWKHDRSRIITMTKAGFIELQFTNQ